MLSCELANFEQSPLFFLNQKGSICLLFLGRKRGRGAASEEETEESESEIPNAKKSAPENNGTENSVSTGRPKRGARK